MATCYNKDKKKVSCKRQRIALLARHKPATVKKLQAKWRRAATRKTAPRPAKRPRGYSTRTRYGAGRGEYTGGSYVVRTAAGVPKGMIARMAPGVWNAYDASGAFLNEYETKAGAIGAIKRKTGLRNLFI